MNQPSQAVFILGAGFTRAFLEDAPLLIDDYNGKGLLDKFKHFKYAHDILKLELDKHGDSRMDLESLMSRLDGRMPYDLSLGTAEELRLLLSEIKKSFKARLEKAKVNSSTIRQQYRALAAFAIYCIVNLIPCITFNYDDVLDQMLWEISDIYGRGGSSTPQWNPDSGYGFFCRNAVGIRVGGVTGDVLVQPSMLLLKLHGSINWYSKLGYSPPYSIDAIMHHEEWYHAYSFPGQNQDQENIVLHLETEPFIVPPVLVKSALVEQPILRLIWSLAYRALQQADQVVFIGYSLPVTDIAASFLFREAIHQNAQIGIVTHGSLIFRAVCKNRDTVW